MTAPRHVLAVLAIAALLICGWLAMGWHGVGFAILPVLTIAFASATIRVCPKCGAWHGSRHRGMTSAIWCRKCGTMLKPPA
jgi:ribosomal protein L40E